MDGVVEIITGRERRRRWSLQDKMRIVAETNEPGSMIRAVAARHGVCESLLFTWRRQAREGLLSPALATRPELTKRPFCTHKRTKLEQGSLESQADRAFWAVCLVGGGRAV